MNRQFRHFEVNAFVFILRLLCITYANRSFAQVRTDAIRLMLHIPTTKDNRCAGNSEEKNIRLNIIVVIFRTDIVVGRES